MIQDYGIQFIQEIVNALNSTTAYTVAISGGKALGISLVLFTFIKEVMKSADNAAGDSQFNIGSIANSLGYIVIILASDWILNVLENFYSGAESLANATPQVIDLTQYMDDSFYLSLMNEVGIGDVLSGDVFSMVLESAFSYSILTILIYFFYILDIIIYALFLCERAFVIQSLIFLFPIMLGLSGLENERGLLTRWIKLYVANTLVIFGFLGVTMFCNGLANAILPNIEHPTDLFSLRTYYLKILMFLIFVVAVKAKLYSSVYSFFNKALS